MPKWIYDFFFLSFCFFSQALYAQLVRTHTCNIFFIFSLSFLLLSFFLNFFLSSLWSFCSTCFSNLCSSSASSSAVSGEFVYFPVKFFRFLLFRRWPGPNSSKLGVGTDGRLCWVIFNQNFDKLKLIKKENYIWTGSRIRTIRRMTNEQIRVKFNVLFECVVLITIRMSYL
ncbi:unnamed protein product [Cuscuta europaea]|uniref:Uncharacterized protein n=1 Tax=Cuscuta europaea TaxID=41803 RepID=A0A9P0ZDU7_CUSEU|nr:unnamed protein product [Cuscuta europaea]